MESIRILIALSVLQVTITLINGFPFNRSNRKDEKTAKRYLAKYGYRDTWSSRPSKEETKRGLLKLQAFAGIKQSGEIDSTTIELMKKERCGLSDPEVLQNGRLHYTQGTTWKKRNLTWKFANNFYSMKEIHEIYQAAFDIWSSVTNINFTEMNTGIADIMITFTKGFHRDPYPFDGKGGAISHVFYPLSNRGLSGDIHYDIDDVLIPNLEQKKMRYMLWTALHNIGHSLGLEHNNLKTSVMNPWFNDDANGNDELVLDDIEAMQHLYGVKESITRSTEKSTPKTTETITEPSTEKLTPKTTEIITEQSTESLTKKTTIEKLIKTTQSPTKMISNTKSVECLTKITKSILKTIKTATLEKSTKDINLPTEILSEPHNTEVTMSLRTEKLTPETLVKTTDPESLTESPIKETTMEREIKTTQPPTKRSPNTKKDESIAQTTNSLYNTLDIGTLEQFSKDTDLPTERLPQPRRVEKLIQVTD